MDIDVVRLIEEVQPIEAIMIRLIIDFVIALIMINVIDLIMMVTQHIPTMTKSHHGGKMSVMIKVGICQ